ncbi:MAG: Threonine dehydrogenase [Myxococcaceae bacterium]|nr:Threonine dehydrogenase [Myxococcaceae bacterium]
MNGRVITEWQVGFGIPGGLPVAVGLGVLLLAVAVLGSRVRGASLGRRVLLVSLRWLSALAAFVLATQPTFWAEQKRSEEGQLAVVLDVSRSMGVATDGKTRSDRLQALVERWRTSARARQVRWLLLGDGLEPVELAALGEKLPELLAPVAAGSALIPRLSELARTDELGAVVVVSDGADTSGLALPKLLGTRVHTVFVPDQRALRDDAVADVRADQVAFLHGEAKVHVSLASRGLGDRDLVVTLSRNGKALATRAVHVAEGKTESLELGFTPENLGREVYSLRVEVDQEDDVPENNERSFLVRVVRDRLRALHVSGRPSWDQRFLRGFLKRDPSIDLISFFILRSVHDLTMSDPSELALIPFPTDELFRQHLSTFDLIVLQDFDYAPYQMAPYLPLIRDYVRNGGGLAMIGGSLSFDGGGYGETALAEVLPVRMRPTDPAGAHVVEGAFSPEPVHDMLHHPLLELYPDPAQTLAAFRALEPLVGANALLGAREGAITLLEHPKARTARGERMPVLSVGSYGKGRVLALGTDTSWHWSMPTAGKGSDPSAYDRFWDRSIRWLTRDPLLEPSSVTTDREAYGPRARVAVTGLARDEGYRALGHSELKLALVDAQGQVSSEHSERSDDSGRVKATLSVPTAPGVYWTVLSRAGVELARTALLVELSGIELARPEPRPKLLQELAQSTGGRYVASAEDAPELSVFDATRSTALGIERHAPFGQPLWATLLFALVALEWVVRRRFGQS